MPPMDQKARDALEDSISHWEANAAADVPGGVSVDAEDCALCREYRYGDGQDWADRNDEHPCDGCPVRLKSGQPFCEGTPYQTAYDAFRHWRLDRSSRAPFRTAAQAEVDFLKSLRE